ncbi:MAG: nucleotidyltransferase family protein [Chloroflexi bacterium]|nr:nucleotidyltransferase family protein [Chloroflexota bacterium]
MKELVIDQEKVAEFCERNDIGYLGLFGSRARGDFSADSDVDLLVHFAKKKSLLELARIERELSALFNQQVQLGTEDSLSPYLKERVETQLKSIYERTG